MQHHAISYNTNTIPIPRNTRVTQMGVWVKKQGSAKVKLQCILGLESIKQCQNIFECCIPFIHTLTFPDVCRAIWGSMAYFSQHNPLPTKTGMTWGAGQPLIEARRHHHYTNWLGFWEAHTLCCRRLYNPPTFWLWVHLNEIFLKPHSNTNSVETRPKYE